MKFENPTQAAKFVRWWGSGDNCLSSTLEEVREAEAICLAAPAILEIRDGTTHGDVIAVLGNDTVAFRFADGGRKGTLGFIPASIGGWDQPVARYRLEDGSPSQILYGIYVGWCLCLTEEDAENIGILRKPSPLPSRMEAILFGSHVVRT